MATIDIEFAVDTVRRAARAGAKAAMAYFRTGVRVEHKADRSPVTAADRASEAAILQVLREDWPDMAVLTEESGAHQGSEAGRFIVDPLDGTRGFTRGGEFWGPLVALEWEGEVVAGAMVLPVLDRTYWAGQGLGAYRDGERLAVSSVVDWDEAILSLGELPGLLLGGAWGRGVLELVQGAFLARCYGDLAGCALVLDGRADAWVEAGVKVWDLAPMRVLVEEAGGCFTDFTGAATIESGNAIAANVELHEHVEGILREAMG
jgi:histidinol-phosphatase